MYNLREKWKNIKEYDKQLLEKQKTDVVEALRILIFFWIIGIIAWIFWMVMLLVKGLPLLVTTWGSAGYILLMFGLFIEAINRLALKLGAIDKPVRLLERKKK